MGLYSPFCVGFIIEDYKKADFLEFPATVFQQVEELFCVVAVVDGVVEFGGDRDFYPAVDFVVFSDHDEGNVADGRSIVVGERIWFGVAQGCVAGVWHDGYMHVIQTVFFWVVQGIAGFPKGFIFQKLFMECSKIFVKISPLMSEEMVGVCAKQSIMRIDLVEVSYLAVNFGIAIVLMFIYGFGDAVAHGWIEFPVIFVNFLEKFRDIQFYSHTVQISVKGIVDFFSIPLFIINWNKHRSNTSFKSKNDLKKGTVLILFLFLDTI